MGELLRKSYMEIGKRLGADMEFLEMALQPNMYSIINDTYRSIDDMMKETGLTWRKVYCMRKALFTVGSVDRIIPDFAKEKIIPLLNGHPCTFGEISSMTGKTTDELNHYISKLKRNGNIGVVNVSASRRGTQKFLTRDLFKEYGGKTIFYLLGDEELVADHLASDIKDLTPDKKKSATSFATYNLPEKIKVPFKIKLNEIYKRQN